MASLASINIKFSADIKEFQTQMQGVQSQLNKTGKSLQTIGAGLTTAVSLPLAGLGALAISAAADMETLKTSLDTVFQGDQNASNKAFEEIKDFAATTPFALDEVATAFIKLKNLGLDPSLEALTSYGNTASALGKSLDQMIEAVADASVGEFERLKEFGIKAKSQGENVAFTFQGITTTVGKNADEISAFLQGIGNVNFAGSIERQANTFKGRLSTLKDNISQAFAGVGEILIQYITPFFEKINGLIKRFQDLSPETKKWIVILGGVAAAIGPILALSGLILPALLTGFTLLISPIGLIIAGVAAIGIAIYKNWEPIKRTLVQVANYFIDLYNESYVFKVGVEAVISTFKNLFEIGKFVFEGLKNIIGGFIDQFVNGFTSVGKIIKAVLTGDLSSIPDILKEALDGGKDIWKGMTTELGNDWKNLTDGIKKNTDDALANITSRKKIAFLKEDVDATGITDAVSEATATGIASGLSGGGTSGLKGKGGLSFDDLIDIDKIKTDTEEASKGLDELLSSTGVKLAEAMEYAQGESMFGAITNQYEDFLTTTDDDLLVPFTERMERLQEIGQSVGDVVGGAFESLSARVVDSLGLANEGFEGFIKGLVSTITKLISMMLASAISQSIAGAVASGTATGPAAIFTTPAFIATAVGGVLAAFAAIPKFATGGIVGGNSFYGDKILARVNSGELMLNSKQQERVYGAMNGGANMGVTVGGEFRLQGDNLVAVVERTMKKLNRQS